MTSKEELVKYLKKYAIIHSCGIECLGYVPSLLFTRWVWDNQKRFHCGTQYAMRNTENEEYSREVLFKDALTPANIEEKALLLTGVCSPLVIDDDVEGIITGDLRDFKKNYDSFALFQNATEDIALMDLSEQSISSGDVADALDEYIRLIYRERDFKEDSHDCPANQVVGRLIELLPTNNTTVFDPFCRFGSLLQTVGDRFPKVAAAESEIYEVLTFIRLALRGLRVKVAPVSSIKNPQTTENGTLLTYPLVITDVSRICNTTESVVYQMDPHHRFQTLLPNNTTLNSTSAAFNAFAFTKENGYCLVVCDRCNGNDYHYASGIFGHMAIRPFLAQDHIEAIIKVPPTFDQEYYRKLSRLDFHVPPQRFVDIFVLSRRKPDCLKNKILFIDASSCTSKSEMLDKVTDVFTNRKEIPGFSAVVPLDKVTESKPPILRPEWFTCAIESPKLEDIDALNRELERLEKQREPVAADIHTVVRTLSEKTIS